MTRKATVLIAALMLASCDTSQGPTAQPDPFPPCTPITQPTIAPVEGLIAPPGSHIYRAHASGQRLTNVRGFVDMEPVDIRKFYAALKRKEGYEFFLLEDEVIEAEAFLSTGTWRNYIRARRLCPGRSELFVLVAPEDYGDDVKLPARTASPSPR